MSLINLTILIYCDVFIELSKTLGKVATFNHFVDLLVIGEKIGFIHFPKSFISKSN